MDTRRIIVRTAVVDDAAIIARAVAMAIGDEDALRNYCGEDYMAMLQEIACREATQYSWQYALVAEVDDRTVGAVVGYDGAQLRTLREGTFRALKECIGRVPTIVDETQAGEYYLDSVAVLPEYRGLGVGKRLIEAFCDRAFMAGYECVGLIVDMENPNAESLYASLGFKRVGSRPFFTHEMWHLQRKAERCNVICVEERSAELVAELTAVWESSVCATHHFLSQEDICEIREYVPMALHGVQQLMIVENVRHEAVAFMGVEDGRLEMLFVAPLYMGVGVGRRLVEYGVDNFGVNEVTVNEQNQAAVGFYEHIGFKAYRRTDCDEQGRPFPLIYMALS